MHPDFDDVFRSTEGALRRLGFELVRDDVFEAAFLRIDGWRALLQGDPVVRPAFNILLVPPGADEQRRGLVLRIVLQAVHALRGQPAPRASLENQLNFLEREAAVVLAPNLPYLTKYNEINAL